MPKTIDTLSLNSNELFALVKIDIAKEKKRPLVKAVVGSRLKSLINTTQDLASFLSYFPPADMLPLLHTCEADFSDLIMNSRDLMELYNQLAPAAWYDFFKEPAQISTLIACRELADIVIDACTDENTKCKLKIQCADLPEISSTIELKVLFTALTTWHAHVNIKYIDERKKIVEKLMGNKLPQIIQTIPELAEFLTNFGYAENFAYGAICQGFKGKLGDMIKSFSDLTAASKLYSYEELKTAIPNWPSVLTSHTDLINISQIWTYNPDGIVDACATHLASLIPDSKAFLDVMNASTINNKVLTKLAPELMRRIQTIADLKNYLVQDFKDAYIQTHIIRHLTPKIAELIVNENEFYALYQSLQREPKSSLVYQLQEKLPSIVKDQQKFSELTAEHTFLKPKVNFSYFSWLTGRGQPAHANHGTTGQYIEINCKPH